MAEIANYKNRDHLLIAVDCIIFGFDGAKLKVLCVKRDLEPGFGLWSLMGGFVGKNESVNDAASHILEKLTGLHDIFMEQLYCFGDLQRDPGGRVVSVAFYALININQYSKDLLETHHAKWFDARSIPALVFDHKKMVKMAIKQLQQKALHHPLGFALLPKKFTMLQLQMLYEAIFGVSFLTPNFHRKMLSLDVLRRLDEKDRTTSRRGTFYFVFDEEKYNKLDKGDLQFI